MSANVSRHMVFALPSHPQRRSIDDKKKAEQRQGDQPEEGIDRTHFLTLNDDFDTLEQRLLVRSRGSEPRQTALTGSHLKEAIPLHLPFHFPFVTSLHLNVLL